MASLDKDTVIALVETNFEKVHGSKPTVEAKGGWYKVNDGKGLRLADLHQYALDLLADNSADAAPVAEKPAPKKAAKKKAASPAAKKVASKGYTVVKRNEDGLFADELWLDKLLNSGCDFLTP